MIEDPPEDARHHQIDHFGFRLKTRRCEDLPEEEIYALSTAKYDGESPLSFQGFIKRSRLRTILHCI